MKTQTIYIEVQVSERLPERVSECFIIVDDYKSVSIFDGTNFFSNDDRVTPSVFLEKKTDQVIISKEDFLKAIGNAFDAGYNNGHSDGADILEFTNHPDKKKYLSDIVK